jgi:hypothetical protein
MYPLGQGFVLTPDQVGEACGNDVHEAALLRPFCIARDLTQRDRSCSIIDFYPRGEQECQKDYPALFQWTLTRVKPERDQNNRPSRKARWWWFAETVPALRAATADLRRFILVPRTAKHFTFQFRLANVVPDTSVVAVASDDALVLGVLSGRPHGVWAVRSGGRLGVGDDPRYQHKATFRPFPFPTPNDLQAQRIRNLGESLDAHRKAR